MKTIVEPKDHILRIWGKQRINETGVYRLMYYVLRVDYDGSVLLHNNVTGQLVELEQVEAGMLEKLPMAYDPVLEQLVTEHYLVPEDYDEHDQVVKLREILHKLLTANTTGPQIINDYTILPTTACNARCYYCFENGVQFVTMSEQTADETVRFIAEHCGDGKKVSIRWFGGEPTVAENRIDQICNGLNECGISYASSITTNGYLFDEDMVTKAKTLWHLQDAMITVDGTEKNYNEIKAYVSAKDNPYQRVLRNVGLLLDHGIKVGLRMNFDIGNYRDFKDLLSEVDERFHGNKLLWVYAFPIKGEYPDKSGIVCHASETWFDEKLVGLNDMSREAGLFDRRRELPSLYYQTCSAGTPSFMVITPEGKLGRCTGIFFREDQIVGDAAGGLTDSDYSEAWTRFADPERCAGCCLFPSCVLIEGCPGLDRCFPKETCRQYAETLKHVFNQRLNRYQNNKGDVHHESSGAESRICAD